MQCYHRKLAWLTDEGLFFKPRGNAQVVSIPCGKCNACRVNNAASWATRAMHEDHYCTSQSCFLTLTYDPEHCPKDYTLKKKDLQNFLKRLRITLSRQSHNADCVNNHIRAFFACGEYGTLRGRPHYHLLLFNYSPTDLVFYRNSFKHKVYTSDFLDSVWGNGRVFVGTLTSGSSAYVARYQKKFDKDNTGKRKVKPFVLSSRNIPLSNGCKGALGAEWLINNYESLRLGFVPHPDKPKVKCKIPDYYFKLLEKWFPATYEDVKRYRYDYAMKSTDGFLIVEDNLTHQPSFYLPNPVPTEELVKGLLRYAQEPFQNQNLSEALRLAQLAMARLDALQNQKIAKLKRRSYDEEDTGNNRK